MKSVSETDKNKEVLTEAAVSAANAPAAGTPPKTKKAAAGEQPEARIYIGPTLKGVAISGTVLKGELPPALQEAIKANPVIKELVVPLSQLVEAGKKLTDQNSALSKFYDMAGKYERRTK